MKIFVKYLWNICTMKRAQEKKVILRIFVEHEKIRLGTKFHISLTPCSSFLPINPTFFFSNIWRKYFPVNLWTVLHPLKLVLIILYLNWSKTGALLLQISAISKMVDSSIVQWFITHASQTMVPILLFHYLPSCLHLIHCQKKQGRVESLDGLDWNTLFRYFSLHMQYCFRYASLYIQFYLEGKKQESGIKIPK